MNFKMAKMALHDRQPTRRADEPFWFRYDWAVWVLTVVGPPRSVEWRYPDEPRRYEGVPDGW